MSFRETVIVAGVRAGTIGATIVETAKTGSTVQLAVGPSPTYSYSAAVVEVEIDTETGWLHVDKIWIAHDIGRALNPTLARGQVEGSVYMGLGEALMEEQAFRRLPPKLSSALCIERRRFWNTRASRRWKCRTSTSSLSKIPIRMVRLAAKRSGRDRFADYACRRQRDF